MIPHLHGFLGFFLTVLVGSLTRHVVRKREHARWQMRGASIEWLHPRPGSRRAYESIPGVLSATPLPRDFGRVSGASAVRLDVEWWASKRDVAEWVERVRPAHVRVVLRRRFWR